jgi:hypothetical protein
MVGWVLAILAVIAIAGVVWGSSPAGSPTGWLRSSTRSEPRL